MTDMQARQAIAARMREEGEFLFAQGFFEELADTERRHLVDALTRLSSRIISEYIRLICADERTES